MNLSRAAKKFRGQAPESPQAHKPEAKKQNPQKKTQSLPATPVPTPQPVVEMPPLEPVPEPVAVASAETPEQIPATPLKKAWPARAKRPRFVFVREKAERRERSAAPALPQRSTKLTAKLLTLNLSLPPKDDSPKTGH